MKYKNVIIVSLHYFKTCFTHKNTKLAKWQVKIRHMYVIALPKMLRNVYGSRVIISYIILVSVAILRKLNIALEWWRSSIELRYLLVR